MYWGTPVDNALDAIANDVVSSNSEERKKRGAGPLNAEDVLIIRQMLKDGHSHSYIADVFGIHKSSVTAIHTGRTWGFLK